MNDFIQKLLDDIHNIDPELALKRQTEYNQNYVNKVLNEQCDIPVVSGSLLEIELIDWDHTCGDGCCYTYGQYITLNGGKLDEQNAEYSKNALTAVLTKLGYNVEINYR